MKRFTLLSLMLLTGFGFLMNAGAATFNEKDDPVEVANLGELREQDADNSTIYLVTGEVILTHQHEQRNQKYFQDETGAILVDDTQGTITTAYEVYDGVTGLKGRLTVFQNLLQFVPTDDPGDATSSENVVEPALMTLDEVGPEHQAMLIRVDDVTFDGDYTTFRPSTTYNLTDANGAILLRTPAFSAALDYFYTSIPDSPMDMVLLVGQYANDMQVFPRSLEDIYLDGVPSFELSFVIMDENEDPITDAVITWGGEAYDAGEYVFEDVLTGYYAYSIEKAGYYTRTGNANVSLTDVELTIVMVSESADAVEDFPWTESFDGETFPPQGWSHYALGDGVWQQTTTGDNAAFHTFTPAGEEADSWLVSPQINVPEGDLMLLNFMEKNTFFTAYSYSGVMISTGSGNPAHGEFIEIYESDESKGSFIETSIELANYAGKVIYIAFVYQGEEAHEWYIKDVSIEEAPQDIPVADIATLRQQDVGALVFQLTGEVFITHKHGQRNQKYIQDGTAAIVIDDPQGIITSEYNLYDGITGIKGTLSVYANLLQFTPVEDPGTATSTGNEIDPLEVTFEQLAPEHQAMLVLVRNVEFDDASGTFAPSTSYNIFDPTGTSILRTPAQSAGLDYFGENIPTAPVHMVALVSQFNDDMQIFPRSLADIGVELNVAETVTRSSFTVYPNPFENYIRIQGNENLRQIIVFNGLGQVMETIDNPSSNTTISTSSYQQGIYFIRFVGNDGSQQVEKIIRR